MRTHVTTRLGYNPSPHALQGVESGWAGNEMAPPDWPPFPQPVPPSSVTVTPALAWGLRRGSWHGILTRVFQKIKGFIMM